MSLDQIADGKDEWPIGRILEMSATLPLPFRDAWQLYAVNARMFPEALPTIQERYDFCAARTDFSTNEEVVEFSAAYRKHRSELLALATEAVALRRIS